MDHNYWHNAWAKSDRPGWQQHSANPALRRHWQLAETSRIFVPLCGRSPDLEWLHQQGHSVVGVELSRNAVERFFADRHLICQVSDTDNFSIYSAARYRIYVGDYFALTKSDLVGVNRVYDRAAMVAMSADLRPAYVEHLLKCTPVSVEMLVILLEYDQAQMNGPPFSVSESAFRRSFEHRFDIELLSQSKVDFSHRGVSHSLEKCFRLRCKNA